MEAIRIPACARCGAEFAPGASFCGKCGQAVAATASPLPYPYYPPVYLPPKKDNTLLIVVIVVVLVIAIPTVLAAVLYIMVSGLIGAPPNPGVQKPFVTFSSPSRTNANTEQFSVAAASPAVGPSNYRVNFQISTFVGVSVAFPATSGTSGTATVTVPGSTAWTVLVNWTDVGGEGSLNAGDVITVSWSPLTGITAGTPMTFYLLYTDGSQIQTESWQA